MTDWKTLKEKYAKFRQWQQTPHTVAPMPDVEHDCFTCGTHFTGNYCPRCGQSTRIGRFSFKSALLLYVDVWGLGNWAIPSIANRDNNQRTTSYRSDRACVKAMES